MVNQATLPCHIVQRSHEFSDEIEIFKGIGHRRNTASFTGFHRSILRQDNHYTVAQLLQPSGSHSCTNTIVIQRDNPAASNTDPVVDALHKLPTGCRDSTGNMTRRKLRLPTHIQQVQRSRVPLAAPGRKGRRNDLLNATDSDDGISGLKLPRKECPEIGIGSRTGLLFQFQSGLPPVDRAMHKCAHRM